MAEKILNLADDWRGFLEYSVTEHPIISGFTALMFAQWLSGFL